MCHFSSDAILIAVDVLLGMKVSCTHLQCAAWAFQQLRDNYRSTYADDWSNEILTFQEQLMLVSLPFSSIIKQ